MKVKKAFPILLSFLAIASIGVLGNSQTAYANNIQCELTPVVAMETLSPGETSAPINKNIECDFTFEPVEVEIESVTPDIDDCSDKGIDVSFENALIFENTWVADELITNTGGNPGSEEHCIVDFVVVRVDMGTQHKLQDVWVTTPEALVGGEFLPISTTALLLAGFQTSAIWIIPVLAGAVGVYYIKTRMNKE